MNQAQLKPSQTNTYFHAAISRRTAALSAALLLVLTSLLSPMANADVYISSQASDNDGYAFVEYSTGGGVGSQQSGAGGFSFEPSAQPGHQFFSAMASVSGTADLTGATADLPHGIVRAYAGIGSGHGTATTGSRAQFFDTLTFNNQTGQTKTITVNWKVEGGLGVTGGSTLNRATYNTRFLMEGPGIIAEFRGRAELHEDPQFNTASLDASGWVSHSIQPFSQGYGGALFSATLNIGPGEVTIYVNGLLDANCNGNAPAGSNFNNTGALAFVLPQGVSFTSTSGILNAGSRMVNIASRAKLLGGDNIAIGGFIITGTAPKKVIVRGIGPSLKNFGVTEAMDDPTLELRDLTNNTVVATNDNWKDTQEAEIQNSGVAPTNTLESAIVRTLNPGTNYSAALRGKNDAPGIGLVEIYDLDAAADSKLANISTRAFINTGDNVLIGGIIGGGNGSQPKVLIRAVGPSLTQFGVPNALQDPVLELHDKNGALIVSNNDWESDQKDAIQATGLAPTNPKESAILATIQPTNYTAIVKGVGNTRSRCITCSRTVETRVVLVAAPSRSFPPAPEPSAQADHLSLVGHKIFHGAMSLFRPAFRL